MIAEQLRSKGVLSIADYERSLHVLGAFEKADASGAVPEGSRKIFCAGSTSILLANAGLLRPLASMFTVAVDRTLLDWLRAAIAHKDELRSVEEDLKELINFLGRELQGGRLHLIPETDRRNELEKSCSRCIADLLLFDPVSNDVICCDDRFVNGNVKRDGDVEITTIYDLLATLVVRGALPQAQSWQLLHQFRTANLWFIPLDADEIVYHLMQAGVGQGGLVETPELKVMRQYWAACAARSDLLQRGQPASNPSDFGEISFLTKSRHAVAEALGRVWAENAQSDKARFARNAWILDSLYLDVTGLRRAGGIPEAIEKPIADCLAKLDLSASAERGRGVPGQNLLPLLAGAIARVRDNDTRQHITSELIRLATWYCSNQGTDDEVSWLVTLIIAHAYPIPGKNASLADFEQLCIRAADGFIKIANALRAFVARLCTDLPVDQSAQYWPLFLKLRAIA